MNIEQLKLSQELNQFQSNPELPNPNLYGEPIEFLW